MNYRLGKSVSMTVDSSIFSADTRLSPAMGKPEECRGGVAVPMCLLMCYTPSQVFYQQMIYRMAWAQAQGKTVVKPFTPQFVWAEGN